MPPKRTRFTPRRTCRGTGKRIPTHRPGGHTELRCRGSAPTVACRKLPGLSGRSRPSPHPAATQSASRARRGPATGVARRTSSPAISTRFQKEKRIWLRSVLERRCPSPRRRREPLSRRSGARSSDSVAVSSSSEARERVTRARLEAAQAWHLRLSLGAGCIAIDQLAGVSLWRPAAADELPARLAARYERFARSLATSCR